MGIRAVFCACWRSSDLTLLSECLISAWSDDSVIQRNRLVPVVQEWRTCVDSCFSYIFFLMFAFSKLDDDIAAITRAMPVLCSAIGIHSTDLCYVVWFCLAWCRAPAPTSTVWKLVLTQEPQQAVSFMDSRFRIDYPMRRTTNRWLTECLM